MGDTNLSLLLYNKGEFRLEDRPIPEPGRGEVQLHMKTVGICGSDLVFWADGDFGDFEIKSPLLLGHETGAVVSKVGDDVTNLKVGDRVTLEPLWSCLSCDFCKDGRYNLCGDRKILGCFNIDGCLARYKVHPAASCFRIPDNMSFEEAALIEPLSVAVYACKRAGVTLGQKVFICGAGPIGLLCLLTAKAMGAAGICISDIREQRLPLAEKIGANYTLLVDSKDAKATAEKVNKMMGCMVDVTLECSGVSTSIQTGIYATRAGGVHMQVGLPHGDVTIPMADAVFREVDIKSAFVMRNTFPAAIEMVASGLIDVKPLLTHHFPLEQAPEAFETARTARDSGAAKVIVHCDRDWKP